MKPKVLITREITGAKATAAAVEALGFEALVCPLIEVELVKYELPDFTPDYLIITSLNAAKTLENSKVPCLVVGTKSASYLLDKGFNVVGVYKDAGQLLLSLPHTHNTTTSSNTTIASSHGTPMSPNVISMSPHVIPAPPHVIPAQAGIHLAERATYNLYCPYLNMDPRLRGDDVEGGRGDGVEGGDGGGVKGGWDDVSGEVDDKRALKFLYLCADHIATDIPKALTAMGHEVRRVVVYKSKITNALDLKLLKDLAFATFYSPRTARAFHNLCQSQNLSHITALALSRNVAENLKGLGFKEIIVAKEPNEKSLLLRLPLLKWL